MAASSRSGSSPGWPRHRAERPPGQRLHEPAPAGIFPHVPSSSAGPSRSQQPLVSVVTIFLDAAAFLGEAIESVLAQTYSNWELLLVDDGSTDGSSDVAREWAATRPDQIRYVEHANHDNRGMSASRNLGVANARGEVVAFLDADDVYLPDKLERQVALLVAHPEVGAVYGATQYWYSWTGGAADATRDRTRRQGVPDGTVLAPGALLAPLMRDEVRTPCTCGVVMRRQAFDAAGGFEERFRGMFEDQAFFFKLFARVPVLVDAGCHDRYRQHAASHCHVELASGTWDRTGLPSATRGEYLRWLEQYVTDEGLNRDDALVRALRRALRPYRSRLYRAATSAVRAAHRLAGKLGRRPRDRA
jgi:glycosyltransferase involved in cell wall biosynthesis